MNQGISIVLPLFFFFIIDLIIFFNSIRQGISSKGHLLFTHFIFSVMCSQFLSFISYSCDFQFISLNRGLEYGINMLSLTFMAYAAYLWFDYLYYTSPNYPDNISVFSKLLFMIPVFIVIIVGILSPWTKWMMYLDDQGTLQYGKLAFIQLLPFIYAPITFFFASIELIKGTKFTSTIIKFPLFAIPSIVGATLNLMVLRGGYTQIGCSIGAILLYLEQYILEVNENKRLKSVEELNTKLRSVNEEQKRYLDIVGSLSIAYICIYYIDLLTENFIEIKSNSNSRVRELIGSSGNAKETFDFMSNYLVIPEYKNAILSFTNLSTLPQRLENSDLLEMQFEGLLDLGWCNAEFITSRRDEEGNCTHVLFAVRSIQQQKLADERNQQERLTQLNLINTLSQDFLNVYVVQPYKNIVRILKLDGYVTEGINADQKEYDYDALSETYIHDRVHEDDVEMMKEVMSASNILSKTENNIPYVGTYRVKNQDKIHYYQYKYVRIIGTDSIIAGFQNIDIMIAAEKEQQKNLEKALSEAEQANIAKTLFFNNMSHDIRTPMNAILGFAKLMEKKTDNPEIIMNYLSKIEDSGHYLLSIINNVLDMARIESGKMELDLSPIDLEQSSQSIMDLFTEDIERKDLTMTFDCHVDHRYVMADGPKLQQILVNLLSNAVKYTPDGGKIHLEIQELPCEKEDCGLYQFNVSDNGIGMGEEFLSRIFDSFARERSSTESRVIGTGLGMSIVKKLTDMMNGEISVESQIGEGSSFTIKIPLKLSQIAVRTEDIERNHSFPKDYSGKNILLAEDNDLNAEIAQEILNELGFLVARADDGVSCIDMLRKSEYGYYDLILMDIQMPNLNGYETTKKIRKAGFDIPIIAMTANAFDTDKDEALAVGMNAYLTKPIEIPKLLEVLSIVLS